MKKLKKLLSRVKWYFKIKKMLTMKKNREGKILLLATPTHGNLGDQAIVYAEMKMLKKIYPQKDIIEIPNGCYIGYGEYIRRFISEDDIVVIDGGGNLGTLWPNEDDKITDIINRFCSNKIIVFPQTCYYDGSEEAAKRIEKNRQIYGQAKDLTVMLRDWSSFELFGKLFPKVKIVYIPDIVLSLKPDILGERNGVAICFREDREKTVNPKDAEYIKEILGGYTFKEFSTVINGTVTDENRKEKLYEKWNELAGAKLIICDRLHAMIFALITKTPCIAIDNKSHKVSGTYDWIKDAPYIFFAKDICEIPEIVSGLDLDAEYSNDFKYPYEMLYDAIGGDCKNGKTE